MKKEMKKNVLISTAICIAFITIFASCSVNFQEETKTNSNFTNNKTLSVQEDENLFPLSTSRKDLFKSIDFYFMLFPDSYIIVKLNENPSICDYGYLLKDSEFGRILGEDIHSNEGTQYVKRFGPYTSKENFDKWSDEMLEDGLIVICDKDNKGQYWGVAYTWEEWRNRNK